MPNILDISAITKAYAFQQSMWNLSALIRTECRYYSAEENVPVRMALLMIDRDFKEKKVRYISERGDVWKSFEETEKDGGGDCEDLTTWVLVRLIKMGLDPNDLGFQIYAESEASAGHIEPLIWIDDEVWYIDHKEGIVNARSDMKWRGKHLSEILMIKGLDETKKLVYITSNISEKIY